MTMKKYSGFTMIELLVAIAIAAIVVAVGVPELRSFVQKGQIITVTNELLASFHVARSEAIRQNASACVCPSDSANDPVPACSGANTWETGWIAFLDLNGNCVIEAGAPGDVLLKVWDGSKYGDQLTVRNNNASITTTNTVVFNSRGEPRMNGLSQQGTFSICDDRPIAVDVNGNSMTASAVILGVSGQARSTRNATLITYTAP